jgi:hypothetical protein
MVLKLEYHSLVRRLNPATVAVLALALLVAVAQAQVNGVPTSVTSHGFGGSTGPRGTPPSVTSLGFSAQGNHALPPTVTSPRFSSNSRGFTTHPVEPSHHQHHDGLHHPRGGAVYAVPYYYPYAYGPGDPYANDDSASDDDEYQGGPTIFDRRGPGTSRPAEDRYADDGPAAPMSTQSEDEPVSNQPDTVLVFKDGHQLEVANYAIVGTTLFDLSEGRSHRIPLSELNLSATAKENDDRGIDFQLPVGSQAN